MTQIVIAFHSGYGHTRKVAEAVHAGAASVPGAKASLLEVSQIDDAGWSLLAAADAIVFGAPGFTCSLNMSGDKFSTLMYFATFAMQHGMIWVGTGTQGAATPGDPQSVNRLGGFLGVMAQADNVPPEQSPPAGDIESARGYGRRIAEKARALRR